MKGAPATESEIANARSELLTWLREPHRNPRFLAGAEAQLGDRHAEIVERFLSWARPAGFTFEVVQEVIDDVPHYHVHWRYQNCELVGFKQPPPANAPEHAKVLACAGLLRNDWCRMRLP